MNKLRPLALLGLALVAACGKSDPVDPTPGVASVTVSPSSSTLSEPGQTVQLSATVRGTDGSTLSTAVTWATSDAGTATVSGSGLVTAVAAGTATITATASGVSGSATVTVNAASQGCENAQMVSLAAGGSAVYDASTCIVLPSGSGGDRYRVAVYRPTDVENANDITTVTLQVSGLGVSQATQAPVAARTPAPRRPIPGLSMDVLLRDLERAEANSRAHMEARAADDALWREHGPSLLPSRPSGAFRSPQRADSPAKIQIDPRMPSSCGPGDAETVTAVLIGETEDLVIYQDSAQHATTPVTSAQAGLLLGYYSTFAKEMIDDYFGPPSDIDGNGKIVMFVTPTIGGDFIARVTSLDFYPQSECSPSNEMELIRFNNDIIQAMDDDPNPSYQALPTLAHEAKHVVSLYHRVAASNRVGTLQSHPSWMEEGTAEIAGELSSRISWASIGGPAVGTPVSRDDFVEWQIRPENYGVVLRMARTVYYLTEHPNSLVVKPTGTSNNYSVYGPGWHFFRWLGDGFGNATTPFAEAAVFRAQNDSLSTPGVLGVANITGLSYAEMLREYFTAVMLHGVAPQPAHAFGTYDFLTATDVLANQPNGAYPWPVTERSGTAGVSTPASFSSATYTGSVGPSGVRIHDFLSNGTGTGAQIEVTAAAPAKILVVRVN